MTSSAWRKIIWVGSLLLSVVLTGCGVDAGGEDVGSLSEAACTGVKLGASPGAPVNPGTTVTLTATGAACAVGETPEYRFAYYRVGSGAGYQQIQAYGFSATANWDTTGLPGGQYDLIVYTRAAGSGVSYQAAGHYTYFLNDVCTSATLSATPGSPQSPGTQVTLTGGATCNGAAVPEFKYLYRASGGPWTQIQNWTAGSANWDTTGLPGGTYTLLVYTRAQGNTSSWEAVRYATYQLGGSCTSVTLSATPPSPQLPGTVVALSATATCGAGLTPEYRFYYQKPGLSTWFLIQDWNGSGAAWDTTAFSTGQYALRVDVRAAENASATEAIDYEVYTLSNIGFSQIAVGVNYTTCGTVNDGTARCWGWNSDGQLGNGATSDSSVPVTVVGLSSVANVAPGGWHTCAARTDGSVRCWGLNDNGQLGTGGTTNSTTPVAVAGVANAVAVASGTYHSCALISGGTVMCWGNNSFGQIGNGSYSGYVATPVQVTGISGATAISAGGWHTCALTGSTIQCWGLNDSGQLGNGTTTAKEPLPVTVSGMSGATALSAGDSHTCAIKSGAPSCWGLNTYGQLGNGTLTDSNLPVYTGLTGMTTVSAGYAHSCARRYPDGSLRCWGNNDFGELGNGTLTSSPSPVTVSGVTSATAVVAAGGVYTCSLMSSGGAKCWGYNAYGQLGDG
ncbi:MAG: hypothetical protein KC495_07295, partial [Dehalococcoidia bacterium]|nr:hypothetical protein [Dehalococcoidia bacterium]